MSSVAIATLAIEQMPVTEWPTRVALTLVVAAFTALIFLSMKRGWNNRIASHSYLPAPEVTPNDFSPTFEIAGRYLATTIAGEWLNRVSAHNLGLPSRAILQISDSGVNIVRNGASAIFIPAADCQGVRADKAIAGKAYETDGILVFTWKLADTLIDTGFRADKLADHLQVLDYSFKKGKNL